MTSRGHSGRIPAPYPGLTGVVQKRAAPLLSFTPSPACKFTVTEIPGIAAGEGAGGEVQAIHLTKHFTPTKLKQTPQEGRC